jgi:heme/copper-type cytochrome/quinol oxidase subunit 2
MNTPTIVLALLTFWLVMGLGFLSKYVNVRRNGKTRYEAWTSYEGLLFILSIVVPIIILIHKSVSG